MTAKTLEIAESPRDICDIRIAYASATFSIDRRYRYKLVRHWGGCNGSLVWIMLNPSTAGAEDDDPTIRRVVRFSHDLGYSGCEVLNLYSLITPYPCELWGASDPIGDNTNLVAQALCERSGGVVLAWGRHRQAMSRGNLIAACLPDAQCLGHNLDGSPKHPLYLSSALRLRPYGAGGP